MFLFKKSRLKKKFLVALINDNVDELERMLTDNDPAFPLSIENTYITVYPKEGKNLEATLLAAAVSYNAEKCTKLLIAKGAQIEKILKNTGGTVVAVAAELGLTDMLEFLRTNGANLDSRTSNGETPLMLAAANGHQECVKLLAGAGAQVDITDDNGQTALHMAVIGDNAIIVRVLLKAGANVNTKNVNGTTALIGAAETGNARIARSLIEAGADKHVKNNNGATALDIARSWEHTKVVNLLA